MTDIIPWSHYKPTYSTEYILVRRAIFMNFVSEKAHVREEDLSPDIVVRLINQVGEDYKKKNKRGLTENDFV